MISFGRILNVPPRGIGTKTRQDLLQWSSDSGWHPAEALVKLATDPQLNHPFHGRAFNTLSQFGNLLAAWTDLVDKVEVADLLDVILEQIGYHSYLDDGTTEGDERWDNVMEFRNAASEDPDIVLSEFLEQIALVSEADNLEETPNATTLLTLHAAKGLEFPVVFISGLEEGLLPHSRSLDDGEELAEERRLLYVGITRAKDRVFLSHAFRRTFFGDASVSVPSRFLMDIPHELIEGHSPSIRRQQSKQRVSSWSGYSNTAPSGYRSSNQSSHTSISDSPTSSSTEAGRRPRPRALETDYLERSGNQRVRDPQFHSGQRVKHAKFGEGMVIESKLTGNDEEVTVAFSEGVKRLAASFANLEMIE